MNKMVRRLMLTSILTLLMIGVTALVSSVALAGSLTEIESNDSVGSATVIDVNTPVSGSLSSDEDEDWYHFSLSSPGKASITFKHGYLNSSNTYWEIDVYSYDQSTGDISFLTDFDSRGSNLSLTSSAMGLPAGDYYIHISHYYYSNIPYTITASFTASSVWEREFNDSLQTASTIKVNTDNYGSLMSDSDEDWYRFTLPSAGKASINFKHSALSGGNTYWEIELYRHDTMTGETALLTDFSSNAGNLSLTSSTVGLPAGTYYIKVNHYYYSNIPYTLTASYTASSVWEREFNDSLQTASTIKVNTAYNGSLMSDSDEDWYRFTLTSSGRASITFKHSALSGGYTYWEIGLYRYDTTTGETALLTDFSSKGGNLSLTSSIVGLPAGTYYVKVNDYYYSNIPYAITASFTSSSVWEREFNDSLQTASTMKLNTTYYGSLMRDSDQDWYRFTLPAQRVVMLDFYHKAIDSSSTYWEIDLYKYNTTTGAKTLISEMDSRGNITNTNSARLSLSAGTYYVNVTDYYYSNAPYGLTASWVFDQPSSVKAVSASYNSVKLTWPAVTGAAGYEVYRATVKNGSYTKLTTTTAKSYLNTNLTTGATYYYKVRAYRMDWSTKVYSTFSSVVSAKPALLAPASFTAARASSSSIKLAWAAVSGASGYEVYRYNASTGVYQLVTRVSSSVRSYTNTGLTKNKVYYYKVRAYRMVGSTRVYGPFSPVKSAKPY